MNEQKLIDALVARARDDARAFREKSSGETPTDLWIENSYTAALPLAKDDAGFDPGPGPHPEAFAAYRREIRARLGERMSAESGEELAQMPTPGEH
jgi:hypothetical protein